jgi:uridine kinase
MTHTIGDAVLRVLDERGPPVVVALDGRSGAGKSTVAAALADRLRATVIPTDDFFAAEITDAAWEARTAAERARDGIDWRRMRRSALDPLLAGRPAVWHPFDFAAGRRADGTYATSPQAVRREPAPVIILDGAYSARPELDDIITLSVLIEVPPAVRLARLVAREEPQFLAAWHERWDAAEDYYFSKVRPPGAFDLIVGG